MIDTLLDTLYNLQTWNDWYAFSQQKWLLSAGWAIHMLMAKVPSMRQESIR